MVTPVAPWEVIVIGAGQAGLATARELVRRGLTPGSEMLVLDADEEPGGAWRHRWDSLTFGRAHGVANLPGMKLEDADKDLPASQVVSDYFRQYEENFSLGVVRPVRVKHVSDDNGLLRVETDNGVVLHSRMIVSATGTWRAPFIPWTPGIDTFQGRQMHTVDFRSASDFEGARTLVVGGGLSAVQLLLDIAPVTKTIWSTRRPPQFRTRPFDDNWGRDVEFKVRERTLAGLPPRSVVSNTGIPPLPEYLNGIEKGILVSRGPIARFRENGVVFAGAPEDPSLAQPRSWKPAAPQTFEQVDIVFWNTGFRYAISHLAPLRLRASGGGLAMVDEVRTVDPRVLVVGYGAGASTTGASREGRMAARTVVEYLAGK